MKVELRDVGKVKPYPNNPRRNDGKATDVVAASIEAFGFRSPIVVDKNGTIICGHTRLLAAKKLGMKKVPVHVADLSPEKCRAYRLADNRTHEYAEWDDTLLKAELDALDESMSKMLFDAGIDFVISDQDMILPEPEEVGQERPGKPVYAKCPKCRYRFIP